MALLSTDIFPFRRVVQVSQLLTGIMSYFFNRLIKFNLEFFYFGLLQLRRLHWKLVILGVDPGRLWTHKIGVIHRLLLRLLLLVRL